MGKLRKMLREVTIFNFINVCTLSTTFDLVPKILHDHFLFLVYCFILNV